MMLRNFGRIEKVNNHNIKTNKMEKQTTAMKQLINWIEERDMPLNKDYLIKLLTIEKQQIIDAYEKGDKYKFEISGEEYYNQTYKQD